MIVPFHDPPARARPLAGGKGASLARMTEAGLPVPPGFVICAPTFTAFLESCHGEDTVLACLQHCDPDDAPALEATARGIQDTITASPIPLSLDLEIRAAYASLAPGPVAVRSSAVCEDGGIASYAGQQDTFLDVSGADAVVRAVQACWASFFSPRAIFYRSRKGRLDDVRMAVVVQMMVEAERSGVMFTVDPVLNRRACMVIEAVRGPGERLVSGEATPDHYVIARADGSMITAFVPGVPDADGAASSTTGGRVLSASDLHQLRTLGLKLEELFASPQDIEWCMRGPELFLLQSRPITTLSHAR
jgi:pyruvate, water dikinase